jgi:transposase-like protein
MQLGQALLQVSNPDVILLQRVQVRWHPMCVEVPHQPARRRGRQRQRFESARHAQRLRSVHSRIHNHLQLRRHRLTAHEHRAARDAAFRTRRKVVGVVSAA